MKTFSELLFPFLKEMEIKIEPKSLSGYKNHTKVFSDWLTTQGMAELPISDLCSDTISAFFIYLATEKKLDKSTCKKYFGNLRMVFKYAMKRGYITTIPFDLITFPKKKKDMAAQVIIPEHMKILTVKMKERDPQLYLAWETQYYCILRPGKELRLLKVGDINLELGTILVTSEHAKTGRKRMVTIPKQLLSIYEEYGIKNEDKNLYLFGKHHKPDNKPCSINMLRWRFNKIRDELNLPKEYKFYSAKHTSITRLHNSGASLMNSMEHAGHSSISAHQHYLHKHNNVVNEVIKNNYPDSY